eukprot:COSAG01_NODE_4695_length_4807_cov_113.303314_2_plen_90_part_00
MACMHGPLVTTCTARRWGSRAYTPVCPYLDVAVSCPHQPPLGLWQAITAYRTNGLELNAVALGGGPVAGRRRCNRQLEQLGALCVSFSC